MRLQIILQAAATMPYKDIAVFSEMVYNKGSLIQYV